MSSPPLSRIVINSLRAVLGEEYTIQHFERLPSRRNEVYKISGALPGQSSSTVVVKHYLQAGIAHETSILQKAHQNNLYVPVIVGSTANALILEFIDAPNLCDLITINPDKTLGQMLASWLASFHMVFLREADQVLVKGDARIRNFLVQYDHLVGVDFEESHVASYIEDLAVSCASILDTIPLFTKSKLQLCSQIIGQYGKIRQIPNPEQLKAAVHDQMVQVLQDTANRRGNPADLLEKMHQFEDGSLTF
jgi:tRNA A-37 threonylcarbamoyl transferase component Bud32